MLKVEVLLTYQLSGQFLFVDHFLALGNLSVELLSNILVLVLKSSPNYPEKKRSDKLAIPELVLEVVACTQYKYVLPFIMLKKQISIHIFLQIWLQPMNHILPLFSLLLMFSSSYSQLPVLLSPLSSPSTTQ